MLAPTSYPATGGPPRPLDGGVQQAQLLARRRLLAHLAGAHAVHARQEAVHAVHTPRVPHLPAARQGPVGFHRQDEGSKQGVSVPRPAGAAALWVRTAGAMPNVPCPTGATRNAALGRLPRPPGRSQLGLERHAPAEACLGIAHWPNEHPMHLMPVTSRQSNSRSGRGAPWRRAAAP